MISMVGFAPHPPIIVPAVGRDRISEAEKTVSGMRELSRLIKGADPELLILITPHGPARRNAPLIQTSPLLRGDFGRFGAPGEEVYFNSDLELIEILKSQIWPDTQTPHFDSSEQLLDHGATVPLYYLSEAGLQVPGLVITFGFNTPEDLYRFGRQLRQAIDQRGLRVAIIASGDLSHCLQAGAPAGYNPRGEDYDRLVVELFEKGSPRDLLDIDSQLVQDAAECGFRSFVIALGAVHGDNLATSVLSYEAPFGVGYMVAVMK